MTRATTLAIVAISILLPAGCADHQSCDLGDRHGLYDVTSTELWGNCGPLSPDPVEWSSDVSGDCSQLAPDTASGDHCTLSRAIECKVYVWGYGHDVVTRAVVVLYDEGDGDLLEGTLTYEVIDTEGDLDCSSTYDVEYHRH